MKLARACGWLCVMFFLAFAPPALADRPQTKKDKYLYHPVRLETWTRVDQLIAKDNAADVLKMQVSAAAKTPERDEFKLELAKALIALKAPIHAQYLLSRVATASIGTHQGDEALRIIDELAKNSSIDESLLEDLAFDLDTQIDDPEARSMIEYFRARALRRKGFNEWATNSLTQIQPDTTWGEELQYDRTLQLLNSGDTANSYSRFEALSSDPLTRVSTARLSKLALARLIFERKDYKAAIATYLTIDLPTRERARSLNELAWSYYYDHAYGRALGIITALKGPYYRDVLSPETFLLEMLIYRELCHYELVKKMAKSFLATYKPIFSTIEARKPLDKISEMIQMALQEGVLQHRAAAIQQIHMERPGFMKLKWGDEEMHQSLLVQDQKRERILDAEISRMIHDRIDGIANWFLSLREQVWFLDYESSMRMIQLNDEDQERYEPPKASKAKPDIMFWPVTDEAWRDELLDYEVLVKDACGSENRKPGGPSKAPRAGGK